MSKQVIIPGSKFEKSSERMVFLLRKEKDRQYDIITRYDNIRIEKPEFGDNKRRDLLKMYRMKGNHGKLVQPCIDQSEIEDIPKVFKRVMDKLDVKKRLPDHLINQRPQSQQSVKEKDQEAKPTSFVGGAQNFSKAQAIYIQKEKERIKAKKFKKLYKKPESDNEEDDNEKEDDQYGYKKKKKKNINPYSKNKQEYANIYKQLQIFDNNKNVLNKECININYKQQIQQSFKEVKNVQATGNRQQNNNGSAFNNLNQTYYEKKISQSLNTSPQRKAQSKEQQILLENQRNSDKYNKNKEKTMISMISGQPISGYIQLPGLKDQLNVKSKQQVQEQQNKGQVLNLKKMEEFFDFDFQDADKRFFMTQQYQINQQFQQHNNSQQQATNGSRQQSKRKNTEQQYYIDSNNSMNKINSNISEFNSNRRISTNNVKHDLKHFNQLQRRSQSVQHSKNKFQRSYNYTDTNYLKKFNDKRETGDKMKESQFQSIIKKTIQQEDNIIQTWTDFFTLKCQKNIQLNKFIDIANLDRPITTNIRSKVYYPNSKKFGNQIKKFRAVSEHQRKKIADNEFDQQQWYSKLLNQVTILCEQNIQDKRVMIYYIMDQIKDIIESMHEFQFLHLHGILEHLETDAQFQYNEYNETLYKLVQYVCVFLWEKEQGKENYFQNLEDDRKYSSLFRKLGKKYEKLNSYIEKQQNYVLKRLSLYQKNSGNLNRSSINNSENSNYINSNIQIQNSRNSSICQQHQQSQQNQTNNISNQFLQVNNNQSSNQLVNVNTVTIGSMDKSI